MAKYNNKCYDYGTKKWAENAQKQLTIFAKIMPERMEYRPEMGDLQAHINVLKNRLTEAQEALETARAKGANTEQAEAYVEQCQEEYDDFMKEHNESEEKPEMVN